MTYDRSELGVRVLVLLRTDNRSTGYGVVVLQYEYSASYSQCQICKDTKSMRDLAYFSNLLTA